MRHPTARLTTPSGNPGRDRLDPRGFSMKPIALSAVLLALVLMMPAAPASAGSVTQQLSADVQRVLDTLSDPQLKAQPDERRLALRQITREVFDLPEMAARCL